MTPELDGSKHAPDRGQLVIAMAVVVTIALVPIAAAYLQLGYAPGEQGQATDHAGAVDRALEQAVGGAENEVAGEYQWAERDDAIDRFRTRLDPRIVGIESPGPHETVAVTVTYNQTRAAVGATTACPSGNGRAFGPCQASQGIVVQERADETVIVAVALDIQVVTAESTFRLGRLYRP